MRATEPMVRTTVNVQAPLECVFPVFTAGLDKWWDRSQHIGPAERQRPTGRGTPRDGNRLRTKTAGTGPSDLIEDRG